MNLPGSTGVSPVLEIEMIQTILNALGNKQAAVLLQCIANSLPPTYMRYGLIPSITALRL
jgi:hypothetical protein